MVGRINSFELIRFILSLNIVINVRTSIISLNKYDYITTRCNDVLGCPPKFLSYRLFYFASKKEEAIFFLGHPKYYNTTTNTIIIL